MKTIFTPGRSKNDSQTTGAVMPIEMDKSGEFQAQIARTNAGMGAMQSIMHRLEVSRMARHHLDGMMREVMQKAEADLRHKLMLAHDLEKKANHAKYFEVAAVLDKQMVEASQELERMLLALLPKELRKIYDCRTAWMAEIELMPLSDAERTRETARMTEWISNEAESVDAKIELLAQNHAKALQRTLTLLGEEPPR